MLTTSATYRLITRNLDQTLDRTKAERPVALETEYYLKNIGNIKSIDDFVKNTRVFNYAMKAFGLDDMAHAKAFMRKVMAEGTEGTTAFANRLADDRFVDFARTFNFATEGAATTQSTDATLAVADRYARQVLETASGEENEGVRLALYFLRQAPTVKTAYGLLADPALWKVVKTTFGFSDAMATADIDKQASAVLQRLDMADLKDPAKLDRLIARFATTWDVTEVTVQDPILTLFAPASTSASVDLELVMTLKSLKHGGS